MLPSLAAAVVLSAVLLLIAARLSPQWEDRKQGPDPGVRAGAGFSSSAAVGLNIFAIAVALPAALGFVQGNVLLVLGGLAAARATAEVPAREREAKATWDGDRAAPPDGGGSSTCRGETEKRARPVRERPWLWFAIFAWSVLAASWSLGTFDLREALAAQAVLGPAALAQGMVLSIVLCLSFLAGLVAAFYGGAPGTRTLDSGGWRSARAWLGWGETALAGAALSAAFFGPSPAAWLAGPAAPGPAVASAASFLMACLVVGAVSWSRRASPLPRPEMAQLGAAAVALASLAAVVLL